MAIKGSSRKETVFHTVDTMLEKGMTIEQAMAEVEAILHCILSDQIKGLIRQECG